MNNLDDVINPDSYILIEHDQSNLLNFHKQMCMTKYHTPSNAYELLLKMDKLFEDDFMNTPYHFYFTIENPSNNEITFSFKSRNFPNHITSGSSPEVFYFTKNYTIEPHKSRTINSSLTFEKNNNEIEGGYFIISGEKGKSTKPYYWPLKEINNGRLEKLTNMEIILESDFPVGISSFSLMRRRNLVNSSYLGNKCNVKNREGEYNGKCGDGYYCDQEINGTECKQCENRQCKSCDIESQQCTQCFIISVDGQWNPPGGKGTNLNCDLDYIDITKVKINGQRKIEVPPAIHWRVTFDFWIWISDTSVLSDSQVNMNIIYKDFLSITLRCLPEGLRIYATPIEWLYEYPTMDEMNPDTDFYKDNILPYIN